MTTSDRSQTETTETTVQTPQYSKGPDGQQITRVGRTIYIGSINRELTHRMSQETARRERRRNS